MSQLELLWDYQQADVEAERQENAMKRSPTRQRLLKYQEYLREQKAANARLEEEVHAMGDRMDALKDAIARLDPRQQSILALRFCQGKTQMEVSSEIGISQAQVSRLEKTALGSIRKNM